MKSFIYEVFEIMQIYNYSTSIIHVVALYHSSANQMLSTYEVLHDMRVVSVEDGCSKPAHVELDISLSCFYVLGVGNIHWLSPVNRKGDSHQTCSKKQISFKFLKRQY